MTIVLDAALLALRAVLVKHDAEIRGHYNRNALINASMQLIHSDGAIVEITGAIIVEADLWEIAAGNQDSFASDLLEVMHAYQFDIDFDHDCTVYKGDGEFWSLLSKSDVIELPGHHVTIASIDNYFFNGNKL